MGYVLISLGVQIALHAAYVVVCGGSSTRALESKIKQIQAEIDHLVDAL